MQNHGNLEALTTIGGYALPEPSSYKGMTSTLVDSARNTAGTMIGSVIRDDVAKVELQWKYLTVQAWSDVLKLFKVSSNGKFINYVRFFDQCEGKFVTREMYVNDRTASMWRRDPKTGLILGWTDCALNLIEV